MLKGFDPNGAARSRLHPGRHQLRPRARGPLAAAPRRPGGREGRPAADAGDDVALPRPPARASPCAAGAIASAMPASTSARRCRCAPTWPRRASTSAPLDDVARRAAIAAVGALLMAQIGARRAGAAGAAGGQRAAARSGAADLGARAEGRGAALMQRRRGRGRARLRAAHRPRLRADRRPAHAHLARPGAEDDGLFRANADELSCFATMPTRSRTCSHS